MTTKGIDLIDLNKTLDEVLRDGGKPDAILLIEASKRFRTCDATTLADAVTFLLSSQYADMKGFWRKPKSDEEAEQIRQRWQAKSQRRRRHLLRRIRKGRDVDLPNQFEIAEWIEEAAKEHNISTIQQLFPLLKRDCFLEERWFELERYFNEGQKLVQQLESDLERLQREAEALRSQLRSIEQDVRAKQDRLNRLREETAKRSIGGRRGTHRKGRFTGIVIRAGEQEGKINPVLKALGLLDKEHGVDSKNGMRLLLKAGYQVEVVKGNDVTPTGAVLSQLSDLR